MLTISIVQGGWVLVSIKELLEKGLLHNDVETIMGKGLEDYTLYPELENKELLFKPVSASKDTDIISNCDNPFDTQGGISLLKGNMGSAVVKTSALKEDNKIIEGPAKVFESQESLQEAFKKGELNEDFVAVVRYQGPASNGMPELHGLMKPLGALQDDGYKVAIVTDGRMSGASGKVPSAIHVTPEAAKGGIISKIQEGDMIKVDCVNGVLEVIVPDNILGERKIIKPDLSSNNYGMGRELFSIMRKTVNGADKGACTFELAGEEI